MKGNHIKIVLGVATSIIVMLITVGNGCSKRADLEGSSNSSSTSTTTSTTTAATPSDFIPGAKTASVVYAKQALDQLTACSGVVSPSDATLRMYDSKKAAISSYGDAISVTPTMMMAITNISGEICNDLINQENSGGKRIFMGWDLSAGANLQSSGLVDDSIRRLAISCWQGAESADELADLRALMTSVDAGAGASRKQALMVCTAMLSSLKSLLN